MQKVILDLLPGGVAPIVYASQYDDGRSIRFMLTEGGPDSQYSLNASEVITCNLTKPDGTETVINVANPGAGKTYVDLVNGADDYDQAGAYLGEIVLTKDARVIGTANFVLKVEEDAYGGQITTSTATGNPCTFTTDLADALVSLKANIVASGGGGTPSTPIPIVGYSSANITRCGVNLWDEQWDNCYWDESNNGVKVASAQSFGCDSYIPVPKGGSIYFSAPNAVPNWFILFYDNNKSFISFVRSAGNEVKSVPNNACYMTFYAYNSSYGTTYNNDIAILFPSTETQYAPFNGQTYTIAFGQTVYGGVYDANAGKVRITHAGTTLNGSETIGVTDAGLSTQMFVVPAVGVPTVSTIGYDSTDLLCNVYTACAWSANPWNVNNSISFYVYDGTLRIKDDTCANVAAFKAYLSNNPVTIVYPLATPIVIDVPSISVFAENGVNNITSDCIGDVDVTYIKKV